MAVFLKLCFQRKILQNWCYLGEGNGTPLQYSCLENPTDGGAWWAAIHGVAKSRTRLSNFTHYTVNWGFLGGARGKEPSYQCRTHKSHGFDPWVEKIPWRRAWQSTPVFLPRESQGRGSLVGCHLRGRTKLDTNEAT